MQKVTFSMCFLKCSGILNFDANFVQTYSKKPQNILSLQLSECLIEISTKTSTKTMNSRNLFFMFS